MQFALSIVLDKDGFIKKDLAIFSSLLELDKYTTTLESSVDIRKKYAKEITSFLEEKRAYLAKKDKKYQGRICLTHYDKQTNLRFFPILYKKDLDLLKINTLKKLIKEKLNSDFVLGNILKIKKYLLSKNELDLLNLYFRLKDIKYKELFVSSFYLRIIKSENKYLYFRSLMNVCDLFKEKEIISGIKDNIADDFLEKTIGELDYEALYHYYDLQELERISENKDAPLGSKGLHKK